MKIKHISVFKGRNLYSHKKCIRIDVDLEGYENISSKDIKGFNEGLIKYVPELKKHKCCLLKEGGFIYRLKEGTYLAHICEHIIIALQNMVGIDVYYGKARQICKDDYYIIIQYEYENTAIKCGEVAVSLINALIKNKEFNIEEKIENIKEVLRKEELGQSTYEICSEAKKLGIPVTKLGDGSLLQLGYGKYSKMVAATITENTSALFVDVCSDKLITKEMLSLAGIPIARGAEVKDKRALINKGKEIGYPLVLKPRFGNQGKGVIVNIKNEKELINAYKELNKTYKELIVEEYIKGKDYRICIVGGEVVAASLRVPPFIKGDGTSTINTLINKLNDDKRRGEGHEKPLTKIIIDEKVINNIKKEGYTLSSILKKGEKLILRNNANLSTGAVSIDCTDDICVENIEIFKRISKAIALDVCGIDICCSNIKKSLYDDGAVIEINAAPGIRMHHSPSRGKKRNVAKAIIENLFKGEKTAIPIVSVTGTNGKTTTTRLISYTLAIGGQKVGMTTTGGIYIGNECIEKGDTTGPLSAKKVLLNREIDSAVLETARGGIIRGGLFYDLADVAVITNITEDHLGVDGIETLEDLAHVKSLVGEAVKDDGYVVINADDRISITILDRIKSNIIFFSKNKDNPYLIENIKNGGYGIYVDNGYLCIQKGEEKTSLIKVNNIGITLKGSLSYNVENAMAACGALVGMGIDYGIIKKGLRTFYSDQLQNPGRFNMFKISNTTIILDYGHNIEGYKAVLDGIKNIKHKRLVGIIGVPGDRLDSNVIEIGRIASKHFDKIYIKEDEEKRGRKEGEIANLLYKGILEENSDIKQCEIILDEKEALINAIDSSLPGDLIVVFFEKYCPLVKIIEEKKKKKETNKESKLA